MSIDLEAFGIMDCFISPWAVELSAVTGVFVVPVDDVDRILAVDEDVVGLEVAVDNARLVGGGDGFAGVQQDREQAMALGQTPQS